MKIEQFRTKTALDCLLLLLVCAAVYMPFLGRQAWDGNEPVRVIVAREMLRTGDWAIPMLHGRPYFVKPPLMNWLIASSAGVFGGFSEWSTRFPSVVLAFAASLIVYLLSSRWLTREGRLFAGLATLTMSSLIQKGTSAEIDTLLIFLVALTLLVWINGYERQWRPALLWSVPLFILGIAFLTKGPQAPGFFYSTVIVYLYIKKRLRYIFSGGHAVGILAFLSVLAAYLLFVFQRTTVDDYIQMWVGQITQRAESRKYSFLEHFFEYPFRVLLSFMPWSLFVLPALFVKELRAKAREVFRNDLVLFAAVMFAVNLPLYWLLPNARVRYFLPAGPFAAIVLAGLFESYIENSADGTRLHAFFRKAFLFLSWTVLAAALISPVAALLMNSQVTPALLVLTALLTGLAAAAIVTTRNFRLERVPLFLALFSGVVFLIYADLDVQRDSKKGNYPKKIATELNSILPADTHTVYELGYRRFLGVTCYLEREVLQVDSFGQLREKEAGAYFLFDTAFLKGSSEGQRKIFSEQIRWEKIYSKNFEKGRGELILGRLKR